MLIRFYSTSSFTPVKQEAWIFAWDSPVSHSFDFLAFVHVTFYITKSYVKVYGDGKFWPWVQDKHW